MWSRLSLTPESLVSSAVSIQEDRRKLYDVAQRPTDATAYAALTNSHGWRTLLLLASEFTSEADRARGSGGSGSGGSGGARSPAAAASPRPDVAELYKEALGHLRDMGFTDQERNLRLLQETNGSLEAVVNLLTS